MGMLNEHQAIGLREVFAVTESIENWSGRGLPKGTEPRFWRAMDCLKEGGAPSDVIAAAEEMGLNLFRLQGLLPRTDADEKITRYKCKLAELGRDWLGRLPLALSHSTSPSPTYQ